ncbi:excinuclease ABC subunit UvrA [Candidatus Marinamargulisbacteria bacterium SCGC AG-343-D04]|nr:excinuclease ABC subunit UvrA [Candidatus Marinamargulisbacteria bacterium SCGC AG-343-D04]
MLKEITVIGANVHNLKNVSVTLPKHSFIVITGVSGSGKSSLAFDTIYAEGQRRYMESLSAYARQFLDQLDKPDVEHIEGLSPAISIDQKSGSKNPRSIVGTVTEIYDYFRLLFSSIGTPYCPHCSIPISQTSIQEICDSFSSLKEGNILTILSPLADNKKGEFQDLFASLLKKGYRRVRVNGKLYRLDEKIELNKTQKHTIQLVIDRVETCPENDSRLFQSVETACNESNGLVLIENETNKTSQIFSETLSCPSCSFSLKELSARLFSFNSPLGACQTCNGLGEFKDFEPDLLVKDHHKPLRLGFCKLIRLTNSRLRSTISKVLEDMGHSLETPYEKLSSKEKNILFYGVPTIDKLSYASQSSVIDDPVWQGIIPLIRKQFNYTYSEGKRFFYRSFMAPRHCASCNGARLQQGALHVKIEDYSIHDLMLMQIKDLLPLMQSLKLSKQQQHIVKQVMKEIISRLSFLANVGLGYLSLSRKSGTLSGGEFQRIRLATQIGSALTGVLYVLDEPSIGLHQRDNEKLIETLKTLQSLGNTLIIVEHDEATIKEADHLVEIGPRAGVNGGEIIFSGTQKQFLKSNCLTAQYMTGKSTIKVPKNRRQPKNKGHITLTKVSAHNLKNISVKFPLGKHICITGVSGSGKSTLIYDVLYRALAQHFKIKSENPGPFQDIKGIEDIDKVITIDQTPIGRTPRSNPVTYIGVFSHIRDLFTKTNEARIRGYKPGRFSFNVKGGRCESCQGDGLLKIEMHFLSDVYVTCDVCKGKRYSKETLEVRYKDCSIADVLDMTVNQACELFENIPAIFKKLKTIQDVGLGYIRLGQSATTLSGGEAQRVKLAKELSKRSTGKTLYLLDEPTTGLHFEDIKCLIEVLDTLVDQGNTVIVIEHNLDVIKVADHIIDIGPEGGDQGGSVVATGTPEDICKISKSHTGKFLKEYLA